MTIELQVGWRQLTVGLAVLVGAVGLMIWWSSPARSQGAGPAAVDTFAFVARADNPVDALAASSAAGQLGAPVYLTFPGGLDEQAAEGLQATDPQVVVLAGGTAALSDAVEQQVRDLLPDATIRRFAGAGRTETAKLINELTGELGVDRPVLAGATVTGDVGIDGALTVGGTDIAAALETLSARVATLEADLAAADSRIGVLESTLAGVSRSGDTLVFSGMNVQVVNGQGATATTNGLGNLIVGYNEDHTDLICKPSIDDCQYGGDGAGDIRTGSHNLVVGVDHTYSSSGGLITGRASSISAIFASVSGGVDNTASGSYASVSGGVGNTASGVQASVSGGGGNTASGFSTSVSGGFQNTASDEYASISGGLFNIASGLYASVTGGSTNTASWTYSTVTGGSSNTASGFAASVAGGHGNTASGGSTSAAGGRDGTVSDDYDSRIGDTDFPDS